MAKVVTPASKSKETKGKSAKPVAKPVSTPQKRSENQQMTIVGVIIAVVLAFFAVMALIFIQLNNAGVRKGNYAELAQLNTRDGTPILGDPTTPIIFREYANFACVHCLDYHSTIRDLIDRYVATGQARLEYRTLVWDQVPSTNAGLAALCASRQGHFWDMHDALFDEVAKKGQDVAYSLTNLRDMANGLDMDGDKLLNCVIDKVTLPEIETNQKQSEANGLAGTPGMMVSTDNGQSFHWISELENGQLVERKSGGVQIYTLENIIAESSSKK